MGWSSIQSANGHRSGLPRIDYGVVPVRVSEIEWRTRHEQTQTRYGDNRKSDILFNFVVVVRAKGTFGKVTPTPPLHLLF